ncbi:MAG: 1-deoxy-D-xylulose-5-phosphate synthase, partial [Candidatus Competibacteraceae bacterium]|nr:1-deoxy-D-xylulose-5-phosphate synthase [Candidatus Competibacteraceae bacterium]
DENETRQMLYTGFQLNQPSAVRYPRGKGPGTPVHSAMQPLAIGKAEWRRQGEGIALLAFGSMLSVAEQVAEPLNASVVNMRFVKPLDETMVLELADSHEQLVTLEENAVAGGAGSAVNECLAAHGKKVSILNIGLPDQFIEQGSREELLTLAGLDADSILNRLQQLK